MESRGKCGKKWRAFCCKKGCCLEQMGTSDSCLLTLRPSSTCRPGWWWTWRGVAVTTQTPFSRVAKATEVSASHGSHCLCVWPPLLAFVIFYFQPKIRYQSIPIISAFISVFFFVSLVSIGRIFNNKKKLIISIHRKRYIRWHFTF